MALVEYEFYTSEYGGSAVDSDSFIGLERRAENWLNRLTFNHIVTVDEIPGQMIGKDFEAFSDEEWSSLQFGLCSLVDVLGKLDSAEQQALAGTASDSNVKSRSSGGESISYESHKTIYDEALADQGKKIVLFRNALLEYIQPAAFRHNPFYAGSW